MENKLRVIKSVTLTGMVINILLSAAKIAAGWFGNSRAVLADGVHSLSDLATDLAVIIGAKYWETPADKNHPYGHKRIETMISFFIACILLLVGAGIAADAVRNLHNPSHLPPSPIALIAAISSIILKEVLYQYTVKAGKKINSPALIANAWHHRSDSFSSIPAALAVIASLISPGLAFLDTIGAIIVTIFIFYASFKILKPAILELTDCTAPPDICSKIEAAAKQTPGVANIHKCRTRTFGADIAVDVHIQVRGSMTVTEAHKIAGHAKHNMMTMVPAVKDVIIHIEPEK